MSGLFSKMFPELKHRLAAITLLLIAALIGIADNDFSHASLILLGGGIVWIGLA